MKRVAILGSTGSIGQSALAVVAAHPDRLQVVALAAGENVARFAEQVGALSARRDRDGDAGGAGRGCEPTLRACRPASAHGAASGAEGLIAVATHPDADVVLFASSGTAALDAVLAAIAAGKTIALANKEILVMAGARGDGGGAPPRRRRAAGRQRAQRHPPVPARPRAAPRCARLILTASGGPFRGCSCRRRCTRSRPRTRCGTRPGGWGRRSPSTRRR